MLFSIVFLLSAHKRRTKVQNIFDICKFILLFVEIWREAVRIDTKKQPRYEVANGLQVRLLLFFGVRQDAFQFLHVRQSFAELLRHVNLSCYQRFVIRQSQLPILAKIRQLQLSIVNYRLQRTIFGIQLLLYRKQKQVTSFQEFPAAEQELRRVQPILLYLCFSCHTFATLLTSFSNLVINFFHCQLGCLRVWGI